LIPDLIFIALNQDFQKARDKESNNLIKHFKPCQWRGTGGINVVPRLVVKYRSNIFTKPMPLNKGFDYV